MSTLEPAAVRVYFDFVSPYSYLALVRLPELGREREIRWRPHPVVYGVLLDAHGLVGPVERAAKRRYTFRDVQRAAALLDIPLAGPPAHPFRSLEALRTVCSFSDDDSLSPSAVLDLTVALARACWGEGRDLTDPSVLAAVVQETFGPPGLDAEGLRARIEAPAVKDRLRRNTDEALERGVFGVPTFEYGDELFWGHDRLSHLEARLDGRLAPPDDRWTRALLDRPRGAGRRGASTGGTEGKARARDGEGPPESGDEAGSDPAGDQRTGGGEVR